MSAQVRGQTEPVAQLLDDLGADPEDEVHRRRIGLHGEVDQRLLAPDGDHERLPERELGVQEPLERPRGRAGRAGVSGLVSGVPGEGVTASRRRDSLVNTVYQTIG